MTTSPTAPPDYAQAAAELLKEVVAGYTSHSKAIRIEGRQVGSTIILRLHVHPDDHGKIVGSQGKNFAALQAIFVAAALKSGKTLSLVLQDQPRTYVDLPPFKENPNWNGAAFQGLLCKVLAAAMPVTYDIETGDIEGTTVYEIQPKAEHRLLESGDLARSFHTIFHAIGKAQGRFVLTKFAPCLKT